MASINYKNKLQEYCQKNKLQMPIYNSYSNGVEVLEWSSKVTVCDKTYETTNVWRSKKEAEQAVASIAYDDICTKATPEIIPQPLLNTLTDKTRYIFIDLENIQPNLTDISVPKENINCFLSTYSSVNADKYKNVSTIHTINFSESDSADYLLTFTAAEISVNASKFDEFIIVSRDRKMAILAYILHTKGFDVLHFKRAAEFEAYIKKMNFLCKDIHK